MVNLVEYKYDITKVMTNNIKITMESIFKVKARYKLIVPTKKTEFELLTIIMLNPSCADKNKSDRTVNRVISHGYCNNYKAIEILNISPFYVTSSNEIEKVTTSNTGFLEINKINLNYIREAIKNNSSHILLATGKVKGPTMSELYHSVLDMLPKEFQVFDITKDGYAWHPRNLWNTTIEGNTRMAKVKGTKIIFK